MPGCPGAPPSCGQVSTGTTGFCWLTCTWCFDNSVCLFLRFKVSGELPLLHVKISDQKIHNVLDLVNSISLPNVDSTSFTPTKKVGNEVVSVISFFGEVSRLTEEVWGDTGGGWPVRTDEEGCWCHRIWCSSCCRFSQSSMTDHECSAFILNCSTLLKAVSNVSACVVYLYICAAVRICTAELWEPCTSSCTYVAWFQTQMKTPVKSRQMKISSTRLWRSSPTFTSSLKSKKFVVLLEYKVIFI